MKMHLFIVLVFVSLWSRAASAQDAPASAKSDVWLPGKPWAPELDGTGFTARANEIQPDGRRYFRAEKNSPALLRDFGARTPWAV